MRQLARRYPDDPDAATLFGEALMNSTNWFSWDSNNPNPESLELLKTLESALKLSPDHPGANHYYIHVIEQSPYPEKGIPSADRLVKLSPGSGHLLHMPSHLYLKQGRYHEAVVTNQNGVKADLAYLSNCLPKGVYLKGYVLHNYHFLWNAASMAGESQAALQTARLVNHIVQLYGQAESSPGAKQFHAAMPLYTMSHFGLWNDILQEPAPDVDLSYLTGVWHFARGNAFRAQGQLQQAKQELQQLQAIAADPDLTNVMIESNSAATLLQLAATVLAAELEARAENYTMAISQLQEAVAMEDKLAYVEPRAWYSPVRQVLGAVLLAAGKPEEAEAVYRQDLGKHPENGWSLYGLAQSLSAQGKFSEAKDVQFRFEKAWQNADVNLLASYF
jgi:tetratricopeptide (TPR) repeat protein